MKNETSAEQRLRAAATYMGACAAGSLEDLERLKEAIAPSKRGSRFQHAIESLESRIRGINAEYEEIRHV